MKKKVLTVCAVALFCLGVVVTRAVWEGRGALSAGDAALAAGDTEEAIRQWRRAARWYAPGAPHVTGAYERLEALAGEAETRGDAATALTAWRGVRGSVLATRSFYVPHEERLDRANRRIAALMAVADDGAPDAGRTPAEREAWHLALLERDDAPSVGWAMIAILGFALWIGGGILFALRGLGEGDRLVPRVAARSGAMVAIGLVIWVLGLYNA